MKILTDDTYCWDNKVFSYVIYHIRNGFRNHSHVKKVLKRVCVMLLLYRERGKGLLPSRLLFLPRNLLRLPEGRAILWSGNTSRPPPRARLPPLPPGLGETGPRLGEPPYYKVNALACTSAVPNITVVADHEQTMSINFFQFLPNLNGVLLKRIIFSYFHL